MTRPATKPSEERRCKSGPRWAPVTAHLTDEPRLELRFHTRSTLDVPLRPEAASTSCPRTKSRNQLFVPPDLQTLLF